MASKESTSEHRRLSLISDIIIFLFIVFVSILLIEKLGNDYNLTEEVEEVFSLSTNNSESRDLIEDENKQLVNNIKKKYGITVLYAKDVKDFAMRLDATEQNDLYIVNNNLKIIEKALEKYPVSAFNMSIYKTNPIYIMLVDSFNNDNLALASRNSLNEYRMYISNTEKFERAFHHEMYHILEYFMASNDSNIYYAWNDLNPVGFTYNEDISKLNKDYVYIKADNEKNEELDNPYFLTKYSKTTPKEDRAEIFAELMSLNEIPNYLEYGKNIRKKVDMITSTIDETVTHDNFYFNKFLE